MSRKLVPVDRRRPKQKILFVMTLLSFSACQSRVGVAFDRPELRPQMPLYAEVIPVYAVMTNMLKLSVEHPEEPEVTQTRSVPVNPVKVTVP
jgi:hypothetical protein